MFDIGSSELLLIIIVAVVVIGPKDLPRALYKLGQFVGKGRAMARHVRTGFDAMVREAEMEELQKQWAKENARIMALHPADDGATAALPAPEPFDAAGGAHPGPDLAEPLAAAPAAAPSSLPQPDAATPPAKKARAPRARKPRPSPAAPGAAGPDATA